MALPHLTPDHAWVRCPTCQARQRTPIWPEQRANAVVATFYCGNKRCPTTAFTAAQA